MTFATIWHRFSKTVVRHPDKPAILQGDISCSFSDLMNRAIQSASLLRRLGVSAHEPVVFYGDNCTEYAAALLGCWANGSIPVLLHSAAPLSQLTHAISLTSARVCLITDLQKADAAANCEFVNLRETKSSASFSQFNAEPAIPSEPASVVFTSGSTGLPKGVTQSHQNLVNGCDTVYQYLGLKSEDRIICPMPWSFDYGYGQLLSTLCHGVTHVLPQVDNPFGVCEAIAQHRATVFPGIPSWFTYLFHGVSPIRDTDTSSIRLMTNTGGSIPSTVFKSIREHFPDVELVLNYGMTETYRSSFLDSAFVDQRPNSIGRSIPGVDLRILTDEGREAEPNEIGELVHRGVGAFLGYWGNPEESAQTLKPDPFWPENSRLSCRAVYTGDLAYRDEEGFIYFTGRRDHMIKSMGVRVSPGEIEDILYSSGLVSDVAVFGAPHEMIGEIVVAAIALVSDRENALRDIKVFSRSKLSAHMLPRHFLLLDKMPKTHSGKKDYPRVRTMFESQNRD